jgi:hypothetical protein
VVYREIADPHPRLDVWLAWPHGEPGVAAQQFIDLARKARS